MESKILLTIAAIQLREQPLGHVVASLLPTGEIAGIASTPTARTKTVAVLLKICLMVTAGQVTLGNDYTQNNLSFRSKFRGKNKTLVCLNIDPSIKK